MPLRNRVRSPRAMSDAKHPPLKAKLSNQEVSYNHVSPVSSDIQINDSPKRQNLSFDRKRSSSTSHTRNCKRHRKRLKIILHSIIAISIGVLIALKQDILSFLFYELIVIMAFFNVYYCTVIIKSDHLHWYQHKLTSIPGIYGMAVPINCKDRENTHRFIGSISELSSYPGSTPHFVLSTTATFVFIIAVMFVVLVLDQRYHYEFTQHPIKISSLLLMGFGAFGFLLAGHWSVFESKIATNLHTAGFFILYGASTVAIFLQHGLHWLCILGAVIVFALFGIYGYIRQKYVLFEFPEFERAHMYSVIEILNEIFVVLVIEAQCLVFIWTVIHEKDQ